MSVRSPWSGSTFFSSRTTDRHEQFYELLRFEIVVLRVPQHRVIGSAASWSERSGARTSVLSIRPPWLTSVLVVVLVFLFSKRKRAMPVDGCARCVLCAVQRAVGNAFRAFSIAPARFTRGRDSSTTAQEALQVTTPRSPELSHPSALSAGRSRLPLQCRWSNPSRFSARGPRKRKADARDGRCGRELHRPMWDRPGCSCQRSIGSWLVMMVDRLPSLSSRISRRSWRCASLSRTSRWRGARTWGVCDSRFADATASPTSRSTGGAPMRVIAHCVRKRASRHQACRPVTQNR